jgi:hypothetical protein
MKVQNLLYLSLTGFSQLGQCHAFVAAPQRINRNNIAPIARYASIESTGTVSKVPPAKLSPPSTVLQKVFQDDNRPIILFDGVCNLCNSAVNLALDWDPKGKLRFSALQSNVGRSLLQAHGRKADDISSIVFVTAGGAFIKSDAIFGNYTKVEPFAFCSVKTVGYVG